MGDKSIIDISNFKSLVDERTREEIAKGIGCDTSLVTKHYNGDRNITLEYAIKYAQFFGVSLDYLVGITKNTTTDPDLKFVCDYTGLSEEATEALHNWAVESKLEWLPTSNEFLNILIRHFAFELCGFSQQYKSKLQKTIKIKKTILAKADTLKSTDKLIQQMFKAEDESKLAHFELKETFDRLVDLFAKDEKIGNQDLDKNIRGKFYFYRYFDN